MAASTQRFLAANPPRVAAAAATHATVDVAALEKAADRAFAAFAPTYVVGSEHVAVPSQFRMVNGFNEANARESNDPIRGHYGSGEGKIAVLARRVFSGRGTPEHLQQVTQKMIDLGKLPTRLPGESSAHLVQRMMWQHGVGVDCTGYVLHALATVHGRTAASLGLLDAASENFGNLARNPRFEKVDLLSARAGDLVNFASTTPGEPGHTVMVARRRSADGAAVAGLFAGHVARAQAFLASRSLEIFEVDSSWGAGSQGEQGGVRRETWVFDRQTGAWASFFPPSVGLFVGDTPYAAHTIVGAFRPR